MIPPVDLDQLFGWFTALADKRGNDLLTVPLVVTFKLKVDTLERIFSLKVDTSNEP
jgi:hypothetical protein